MSLIHERASAHNKISDEFRGETARVVCPSCGREVARRARQQRFCSDRCKERGRTRCRKKPAVHALKIEPCYPPSGAPTNPLKKASNFNGVQGAKSRSSPHILAPAQVLA